MSDAGNGLFDVVLGEALDRFSRDQEDTAGFYKRMHFADVTVFTVTEGDITPLHIGLKGTMNELFLKDLARKTRRGLRGRIDQGRVGGGNSYGYDVVRELGPDGLVDRGRRSINEVKAEIVRWIFEQYVLGVSPAAMAKDLNRRKVPSPSGGEWGPSTIYGNRQRGNGILNNELYIGRLVWNRQTFRKNPDTGKRVSRMNPREEWVIKAVPDFRIIPQELWDAAKEKQGNYNKREVPLHKKNRPVYLLSHMVKCGCCGGGYAMHNKTHLACSTAKNKGTCDNRKTIIRVDLEEQVIGAIREHLMNSDLTAEFCRAYNDQLNLLNRQHNQSRERYNRELNGLEKERQSIIQSISGGVPPELIKDQAVRVHNRMTELKELLANSREEKVIFHPKMADRYQQEIERLIETLNEKEARPEARNILRSMIEKVVLTPSEDGERLVVDLVGDLAGILTIATAKDRRTIDHTLRDARPVTDDRDKTSAGSGDDEMPQVAMVAGADSRRDLPIQSGGDVEPQAAMVAGAGFEPATFRL
ncbi:MAG: recombinase family protein [Pseudomonadota bacterium]